MGGLIPKFKVFSFKIMFKFPCKVLQFNGHRSVGNQMSSVHRVTVVMPKGVLKST